LTAVFYFIALPVFRRLLKFFPPIVVGTMLLLVSVNLVKIYGGTITGKAGTPGFADPVNIGLALLTIALTVIFARVFTGMLQRLSVMLGLVAGAIIAFALGHMDVSGVLAGPVVAVPHLFPFGMPTFNLVAAIPLIVFSIISMAEATGQTIATVEIVGKPGDARAIVPSTIRGDALVSLVGGLFGTSLIITSGENIGIVRATNVKSRYVTAVAGAILVLIALFAPVGRLAASLPGPVVGGTAVVVFSIIGRHRPSAACRSARAWPDGHARRGLVDGSAADPRSRCLQPISTLGADGAGQWPGSWHDHGRHRQRCVPVRRSARSRLEQPR
jgi:xanthine/uracil permease